MSCVVDNADANCILSCVMVKHDLVNFVKLIRVKVGKIPIGGNGVYVLYEAKSRFSDIFTYKFSHREFTYYLDFNNMDSMTLLELVTIIKKEKTFAALSGIQDIMDSIILRRNHKGIWDFIEFRVDFLAVQINFIGSQGKQFLPESSFQYDFKQCASMLMNKNITKKPQDFMIIEVFYNGKTVLKRPFKSLCHIVAYEDYTTEEVLKC